MEITSFFTRNYLEYAAYDSFRSIGNFIDGLKPSSRKVLYCILKRNITIKEKVSILASDVARETQYLHGTVSLEGVIVGMAQNFPGANNLNVLLPNGSFGNRTIQESAASRYIFTKKNPQIDNIFLDIDSNILVEQHFEGKKIEPKFFVPTLPMLLINGSEGIGNGFAQKILPRNIESIKEYINNKLEGKVIKERLLPWFQGFSGEVIHIENNSYEIRGKYSIKNKTNIEVTELPIGYDLEKYIGILDKLEESKIIQSYIDKSENNNFNFEIKVSKEFTQKKEDWIFSTLKLIKRVTENFTCIGENNEIVEFKNELDLIDTFIEVKLKFYGRRKEYILKTLETQILMLKAKYFFIKNILEDNLVLNKKTKAQIIEDIKKITEFDFINFTNFSLLLNLPLHSLSKETFDDLEKEIKIKQKELNSISSTTPLKMWKSDLKSIETLYNK